MRRRSVVVLSRLRRATGASPVGSVDRPGRLSLHWKRVIVAVILLAGGICAISEASAPSVLRELLPHRPADDRPAKAKASIAQQRFSEAAEILDGYLEDHPEDGDSRVQLGWCRYRTGQFPKAHDAFAEVLKRTPKSDDARVGLGYVALQTGGGDAAAQWFRDVLSRDATHRDALEGMVLAGRRQPVSARTASDAIAAARRLESLSKTFRPELLPAGSEKRLRGPDSPATALAVPARAIKDFIEIADGKGGFEPIFIKGFNLGVALPGRFAAEFPTDENLYRQWLDMMAGLGANAVRVYTLLPPEFYRALKGHNASSPDAKIWLIQGVWTELPPNYDFAEPEYRDEFHAETARIIDAVHGNLVLGPRAGHAFGVYNADASASVLAYIIGREWEPFAVSEFDRMNPTHDFNGTFFQVTSGRPMECWVASMCEYAAGYEATQYRVVHPLTFANWPTLDPLSHVTEANREEEDYWRERNGVSFPKRLKGLPWEDDAVTLDATMIHPTAGMPAGFFAAYHIYPNYPEFMNIDPAYDDSRDEKGIDRYTGYLAALKKYHGDQPVLVAEFGIATSRGVAHVHPQGWNHGGLTEAQQGELVSRMLQNIHDQRYAGGVVFEFLDEWFKSAWSVAPFECPADHRRLWFNAESPEESYGILAARPGSTTITLDGNTADWSRAKVLASK